MNRSKTSQITFLFLCVLLYLTYPVLGQPISWTNPNTGVSAGDWTDASNWSTLSVPTSNNNAQINNGGEAVISSNIEASRIEIGRNGGFGSVTSEATDIEIIVDSDLDIGEIGGSFASGAIVVMGEGSATISNAAHLLIGESGAGDLDLGQTNATSGAEATGVGSLTLNNVALVQVVDDADIGQADGSATANANGSLFVNSVADFQIGLDLDLGQAGGAGQSSGVGLTTIENSQVTIGVNADIGRSTGSLLGNSGNGTLTAVDSTVSIGFADALQPGSLNIGDVGASIDLHGSGSGAVIIERSTLTVADNINVGGLSGGSESLSNTSNGSLTLINSLAEAADVVVANIASTTAGDVSGSLVLDASLLTIDGVLDLGTNATVSFELAGTTRADGSGAEEQYAAIDALSAILSGNLEVSLEESFTPVAGDQFDLITSTGLISNSFDIVTLPTLTANLEWNIVQTDSLFRLEVISGDIDADFDQDGDVDGTDFLSLQRSLGTSSGASRSQGDADLDGDVDQVDLDLWESNFGQNLVSPSISSVPEPATLSVLTLGMLLLPRRIRRSAHQ